MSTTTRKRKEHATMSATGSRDSCRRYAEGLRKSGEQCHGYGCGERVCVENASCYGISVRQRCMCARTGEGDYPNLCECCAGTRRVVVDHKRRQAERAASKKKASSSHKAKKARSAVGE